MRKEINLLNVQTTDGLKSYVLDDVSDFVHKINKKYSFIGLSHLELLPVEVEFCDEKELLFLKNSKQKYSFKQLNEIIDFDEIFSLEIETNYFNYDEVYYFRTKDEIIETFNCLRILDEDRIEYNFIHGDNCGKVIYSFDILYSFLVDDYFEIIEECEFFKEYMRNPKFDKKLKLMTYENTNN
jgi:hypothetical protein